MLDQTRHFPDPVPPREPIFNIPAPIVGVLAALIVIHAVRQVIPDPWDNQVLLHLSFLPGMFTNAVDPGAVEDALRVLAGQGEAGFRQAQVGRYILMNTGFQPWTILTYGLLHADWTHVGLNSLWLLAFGSPVSRRLGGWRFLALLAATTAAGALAHYLTHPVDLEPVIGASAAVSGCMGASLRFMFQPHRPSSAIIGHSEGGRMTAFRPPLQPLRGLLRNRRAMTFLIAWFLANLLFGVGIVAFGSSDAAVAWQAHIGGFVCGLLALPVFDRKLPPPPFPDPDAPPESRWGSGSPDLPPPLG